MSFGDQTLTFVSFTESGQPGWGGLKAKVPTETPVPGCHFYQLDSSEAEGQTEVATEHWMGTCPPVSVALNAKPSGVVKHAGVEYRIDGLVQPNYDFDGVVSHVNVRCKRQVG